MSRRIPFEMDESIYRPIADLIKSYTDDSIVGSCLTVDICRLLEEIGLEKSND